jgi:hypothetical protein
MGTDTDKTQAAQAEDPHRLGEQAAETDAVERAALEGLEKALATYAAAAAPLANLEREVSPLVRAMASLVRSMPPISMQGVELPQLPVRVRINPYLVEGNVFDAEILRAASNIAYPAFGAGPGRREPVTKRAVSIPESTWAAVEALSEAEGISRSAWLSRAADQAAAQQFQLALARQAAEEYAAEYEDEHGPISDKAVAEARAALGLDDEGEQVQAA